MQIALQETGLYHCLTQERAAPATLLRSPSPYYSQSSGGAPCMHHACLRFLVQGSLLDAWTLSVAHTFLLLSPDCFTDELLHRWKWQLWAKPSGFNPCLFHSASGGSLSAPLSLVPQFYQSNPGEPCVPTWTHGLSQRSQMVALSWGSWSGCGWVQAVFCSSLHLPERSPYCYVFMVEIWVKVSSSCSPGKPLDCWFVRCNTEHARPASQEASHTAWGALLSRR